MEKTHTCYGCPYYYKDKAKWPVVSTARPTRHCGQDQTKCPYYLGEGKPLESRRWNRREKLSEQKRNNQFSWQVID